MSDFEITIEEVPVFVEIIQPQVNFQIGAPTPLSVRSAPIPHINVQVINPPPVQLTISLESGPPGPPGPPGPRGSLFLGGYPSFANLPVANGTTVKVGDFALVQDESAIYELE